MLHALECTMRWNAVECGGMRWNAVELPKSIEPGCRSTDVNGSEVVDWGAPVLEDDGGKISERESGTERAGQRDSDRDRDRDRETERDPALET